jgi:hypothetical protein
VHQRVDTVMAIIDRSQGPNRLAEVGQVDD